jgi:hypothetical protein
MPAIGGSTVLLLGLAGAGYAAHSHGPKVATASHAAAAGDGFPRTLAEINAWYAEPPVGQNAAAIFVQGFDALQLGNGAGTTLPLLGKATLPPLGTSLTGPQRSAVAAFVRANKEALHFFAQGAKYEHSRYPVDLTAGFEARLPHLPKVRSAALVLELSAILHGEAHEGKQAADDVLSALALARSLQSEPCLLSQSTRAAAVSIAVATFEQTVNRTALPPESLSELMSAQKKMEEYEAQGEGVNRGLVAERATWMALLDTPQKLVEALSLPGVEIPTDERQRIFTHLQQGGKLKDEQTDLEQTFGRLIDARQAPFPAPLKADALIQEQMTQAAARKLTKQSVINNCRY